MQLWERHSTLGQTRLTCISHAASAPNRMPWLNGKAADSKSAPVVGQTLNLFLSLGVGSNPTGIAFCCFQDHSCAFFDALCCDQVNRRRGVY